MKRVNRSILAFVLVSTLLLVVACKKDKTQKDPDKDTKSLYSFSNTEYTGLANVGNHYFPRPLSLRFGAKDSVTAWSHLTLSVWRRGDVRGKITKVEEGAQGETTVTILFDLPGDEQFNSPQVYTISADKKTITGGSSPIISMVDMKLFPKDAPSIVGVWSQPQHPDWFPDVNVIAFDKNGQTNYTQGGKPVYYVYDDKILWRENYKQDGSRLRFAGINPDVAAPLVTIIPYYGVLSSDGKILYVDAYDFAGARITTTLSTFEWYGPKRVTPWLIKQ
ncbi:hypothetical protein [Mucilaginibacter myungsuensis]|uniref:WD40 repeat protein n=1 Tax=Mucilaginibacter myungsuensis TaxID=649104 RepID=A0A929L205_9SPHI|nr:hypothetical protein [Mucilaginibacter myungsuensis]MBE9663029.1 hypothetical protein [Mucilaginibacter myungsuensis]MDN3598659.1 hypothetical protein [Mucilaginibacter myungsuensis]